MEYQESVFMAMESWNCGGQVLWSWRGISRRIHVQHHNSAIRNGQHGGMYERRAEDGQCGGTRIESSDPGIRRLVQDHVSHSARKLLYNRPNEPVRE